MKYIDFLKKEVAEYEDDFKFELKGVKEYADEHLKYARGSDYDLMVGNLENELHKNIEALYWRAVDKGLSDEELAEVFNGYTFG